MKSDKDAIMAINPVSSSAQNTAAVQLQNRAANNKEVEGNRDKADAAIRAASIKSESQKAEAQKAATQRTETPAPPRPTVNTSGQAVGTIINTTA